MRVGTRREFTGRYKKWCAVKRAYSEDVERNIMSSTTKELMIGVLKSGLSAIPVAGGALNEVLFEIRGRIAQQRLNDFTNSFIDSIRDLGIYIDKEKITSENFNDIYFLSLSVLLKQTANINSKYSKTS